MFTNKNRSNLTSLQSAFKSAVETCCNIADIVLREIDFFVDHSAVCKQKLHNIRIAAVTADASHFIAKKESRLIDSKTHRIGSRDFYFNCARL